MGILLVSVFAEVWSSADPDRSATQKGGLRSPASVPGVTSCADTTVGHQGPGAAVIHLCVLSKVCRRRGGGCSALALLVPGVVADHQDSSVTTDHLALVADLLHTRLDLHGRALLLGRVSGSPRTPWRSLVAVDDAPTGKVVRRELHHDPVLGQDADVVLTHLATDVCEDLVAVFQLDAEHRVGKRFDHSTLDLNGPVLLAHVLRVS